MYIAAVIFVWLFLNACGIDMGIEYLPALFVTLPFFLLALLFAD